MQLTKDDIKTEVNIVYNASNPFELVSLKDKSKSNKQLYIDYNKLQQVVEFYGKYLNLSYDSKEKADTPIGRELLKLWKIYIKDDKGFSSFGDWLYNHCFVEGLK